MSPGARDPLRHAKPAVFIALAVCFLLLGVVFLAAGDLPLGIGWLLVAAMAVIRARQGRRAGL